VRWSVILMVVQESPRIGRILVVDVGGTHVKASCSDAPARKVRFPSGPAMTPERMVRELRRKVRGTAYDAVAIGYPGLVRHGAIVREPYHLGKGWVGFDFAGAFGRPTRITNDAAMQALGSYRGGSMLFLGLGSGLGSALIVEGILQPMELAHLPYRKGKTFEEFVGEAARLRLGRKKWQKEVYGVVDMLSTALEPDYVVLGGGNVRKLKNLPARVLRGSNRNAFLGGVRLWGEGARAAVDPPGTGRPGGRRRTTRGSARQSTRPRLIRAKSSRVGLG
jgi:glucose-6-phosphate isomerase